MRVLADLTTEPEGSLSDETPFRQIHQTSSKAVAQYRARGNIRMTESRAGAIAVPDVVPRLSTTPGGIRWLGEGLGSHNAEIFHDLLGLKDADLDQMRDAGVI